MPSNDIARTASHFVESMNSCNAPTVKALTKEQRIELAEHEVEVRRLAKRTAADLLSIGRHLSEARKILISVAPNPLKPNSEWNKWLSEKQPDISPDLAKQFILIYETFGHLPIANLPLNKIALLKLSQKRVPESVRLQAIERAKNGEQIGEVEVNRLMRHLEPPPTAQWADDFPKFMHRNFAQALRVRNISFDADVFTKAGHAHFVTDDTVFEVVSCLGPEPRFHEAIGKVLLIRQAIDPMLRAAIVVAPAAICIKAIAQFVAELGITIVYLGPEEIESVDAVDMERRRTDG